MREEGQTNDKLGCFGPPAELLPFTAGLVILYSTQHNPGKGYHHYLAAFFLDVTKA
jgi:hypothetical protein